MPQAILQFGGLNEVRGFSFTLSRGISPSAFTFYMLPKDGLDPGVSTLRFGVDGNTLSLSGCILTNSFIRQHWDSKWPTWAVCGFDRRWKWKFSSVSGDYNRRKADGTLDTGTQKSPGELASLLGQALGETIDTSRMPSGVFPRAMWKNQRADLALQWLCEYVACEVVLNPVSDSVEIWPLGVGQTAPTGTSEVLPKYRYVPRANIPSAIEVHCGDSLYQTKLQLKAVAANANNDQKLLANWDGITSSKIPTESPFSFQDITDTTKRTNAYEGYLKTFRVTGQQNGSLTVPNCSASVSAVDQYILNDFRLDVEKDLEGYYRNLPYFIEGDFYAYTDLPNNASSMRFTGATTLYKDRRVVQTRFPVFKLDSSGKFQEPTLYLTTSYKVQDNQHNVVHLVRSGGVGGSGGTLILRRPEIYAAYATTSSPSTINTESQASSEADQYVSIFQQKFSNPQAAEITYGGMFGGSLDGVIAQAKWEIHPSKGITTSVYENFEGDIYSVGEQERWRRQALERLTEAAA